MSDYYKVLLNNRIDPIEETEVKEEKIKKIKTTKKDLDKWPGICYTLLVKVKREDKIKWEN